MNDIQKLEKLVKEQGKQIVILKRVITQLQGRIIMVSKKTDRSYYTGKKNAGDINKLADILKQNR